MPGLADIPGTHVFKITVLGQATAGTADEWAGFVAPYDLTVTGVTFVPAAAVTGAATHHCTLRVRNRGAAATGDTEVAVLAFDNGVNAAAFDEKTITLSGTTANLNIEAGDVVTVEKVIVGNGLAMPDGVVVVSAKVR